MDWRTRCMIEHDLERKRNFNEGRIKLNKEKRTEERIMAAISSLSAGATGVAGIILSTLADKSDNRMTIIGLATAAAVLGLYAVSRIFKIRDLSKDISRREEENRALEEQSEQLNNM